jgi:hypothetical protein
MWLGDGLVSIPEELFIFQAVSFLIECFTGRSFLVKCFPTCSQLELAPSSCSLALVLLPDASLPASLRQGRLDRHCRLHPLPNLLLLLLLLLPPTIPWSSLKLCLVPSLPSVLLLALANRGMATVAVSILPCWAACCSPPPSSPTITGNTARCI